MAMSKGKRWLVSMGGVLLVLIVAVVGALQFEQREVKERVIAALGPLGSAESIRVGLTSVHLSHVLLKAPPGWPAGDPLRADEIILTPDIRDLIARRMHIRSVVVRGFDMAVLRSKDGTIRLLPNLRQSFNADGKDDAGRSAAPASREKLVDHIRFEQGNVHFHDMTVGPPAFKVTVSNANATVDHLHLPALSEPTSVDVTGSIKGPAHTGTVSFGGWIKVANKDSQTVSKLHGVDVVMLDPYLLKKAGAKAQVTGGTIDLTVESTVRNDQLHAPGTMTVHGLQLAESGNPLDTFMSIPTKAAVAALKARNDDITLHFVLDGNLRDPKFSVQESLMTRIAAGFAKALGVSVEGVAKGAGETVKGLGNALKNLLGQ
ncbi:DUF748 domain-containing protein [Paraburkholderia terricola]|uniref:DUF748 domain-containing protein n=1 Tax=Paraburkholderia terricola TaxID=169427 RepID=A0A1M6U3G7_9BURK|nr:MULTISPECIES: DUF748 domain-containing protein [Paraburkholderia]ORC45187.1 hypothetical protein B2G74_31555 [Burkholderia sp. A27]SDO86314.1 protein of unknown function [Paraburkholderia sediminicola]SHK63822.1 protein of unknown function [Paraburkholderia terricola]